MFAICAIMKDDKVARWFTGRDVEQWRYDPRYAKKFVTKASALRWLLLVKADLPKSLMSCVDISIERI